MYPVAFVTVIHNKQIIINTHVKTITQTISNRFLQVLWKTTR